MSIVAISSVSVLKREIDKLHHILSVPETEDTWESLSKGIQFLTVMCKNGACDWPEELVPALRLFARPLIGAMNSERTRLSGVAIDFIASVASGLGSTFEPLLQIYFPALLTLSGRANKVVITRARACIVIVVETTQLPSILPHFLQSMKDKSTSLRLTAAEGTLACLNCFNPPDLENDQRAREVEAVIRATARDANADIRKVSRKIFEAYKLLLPDRVDSFTGPLSPTMKKYLDIKTLNIQSQPIISSLASDLETRSTLSASTSAIPPVQRPSHVSQYQAQHLRSASSSAISLDERQEGTNKPIQRRLEKPDMPPPQYVPIRTIQPSQVTSMSRSTSEADSRKRTVPRSTIEEVGSSKTAQTSTPAYPARPASASSLRPPPQRTRSNPALQLELQIVAGPRRVPFPETSKDSAMARAMASTLKSQSTIKPSRSNSESASKPDEARSVTKQEGHGSNSKPDKSSVVTIQRIPKARGLTQPTLAQLARNNPLIERKAPTVAVPKPLWGSRPVSKAPGKKVVPVQNSTRRAPAVPHSRLKDKFTTPAQIPLPPSPPPSVTQLVSSSRSTTPGDVDSFVSMDLPPANENQGEGVNEGCVGQDVSNDIPSNAGIIAPTPNQYSSDDFCDENPAVDETIVQLNSEEPTTPNLLAPGHYFESSSNKTPISTLLSSIQRGFLFTPSSPLSPPQSYSSQGSALDETEDPPIPFPLHNADLSGENNTRENKTFMFGVISDGEANRRTLRSVENLNIP